MLVCPQQGAQAAFPYSYFEVYQNPTGRMSENVRLCPFFLPLCMKNIKDKQLLPQFCIPSAVYLQDNDNRIVYNNKKQN